MKKQYNTARSLDVRGVSCPVNAVRVKQAISELGDEELIEVLVDAGESLIRVVQSINDAGHRILKSRQHDDAVGIIVGRNRPTIQQQKVRP